MPSSTECSQPRDQTHPCLLYLLHWQAGSLPLALPGSGEFSGGLAVRVWYFHCHGPGSIPGPRTKIPQATWRSQKYKK